jgi:hypothetical protein
MFRFRRQVTNTGSVVADAMRANASFTVDGAPSMGLDMAFGNGLRETRWSRLPPGEIAFDERDMEPAIFDTAGEHVVTMTVDGVDSTVHVRVDP